MKKPAALLSILVFSGTMLTQALSQTASVTELKAQFDERVQLDVLRPHELAVADLNTKFAAALERAKDTAQKSGKLEDAIALKIEKEAVLKGGYLAADDVKVSGGLKTLRGTYRTALARLELDRDKKLRPLKDALAKSLASFIDTLTKDGKLEEAIAAKKMREEILANTTGGGLDMSTRANAVSERGGKSFINSLGMKFVQVPGTNVLCCIHETRYKDYAAYAAEVPGVNEEWKNQNYDGFTLTERAAEHPVTQVSWEDAQAFCQWLSKNEGKTYRLPTDEEWSTFVGLGRAEKRPIGTTPAMLNQKDNTEFPWGADFPPKTKDLVGNYSDESRKAKAPNNDTPYLENYDDGYPTTAPVMSYKPNKLGLYDLGGNVWEWCEDWFDNTKTERVLRGSSWYYYVRGDLLSSHRAHTTPGVRRSYRGFRCVVDPGGSSKSD